MSIHQVFIILWARKLVIIVTLFSAMGVSLTIVSVLPKSYTAVSTVILDVAQPGPVSGQLLPTGLVRNHIRTQIRLINSGRVAGNVVNDLGLVQSPVFSSAFLEKTGGKGSIKQWIGGELLRNLKVMSIPGSYIIAISFSNRSPELAASVANAFTDAYIRTDLELRVEPSRRNAQWYAGQLNNLRQGVSDAQSRLTSYQQKTGIVSVNEALDTESAKLADLTTRVTAARAEATEARSIIGQLEAYDRSGESEMGLPDFLSNQEIERRREELTKIESHLASISGSVGENHPQYKSVLAGQAAIEEQLKREVRNLRQSTKSRVEIAVAKSTSFERELELQKDKLLRMREDRDKLESLSREVEIKKNEYDNAFRRAATLRLKGDVTQTAVAIMEKAFAPMEHSFPQKTLSVSLATGFGLILGIVLAFLFEMFDRRIRSNADLEHAAAVPVLIKLGKAKGARKLWKFRRQQPSADESYPSVATSAAAAAK